MLPWSFQIMLVLVVSIAAAFDLRYRRIPNWLVSAALLWSLAANALLFSWPGLQASLFGVLIAFIIYFPLFALRGMGAGDVKLMMAVGALVGPINWLVIFVMTSVLGAAAACVIIARRRRFHRTVKNIGLIASHLARLQAPAAADASLDVNSAQAATMPHGATIAAASVLFLVVFCR